MYLVGTEFKYDFLPLYLFLIKFKFVSTNYWCKLKPLKILKKPIGMFDK